MQQELEDLTSKLNQAIDDRNLFETNYENISIERDSLNTRISQLENSLTNSDLQIGSDEVARRIYS